MALYQIYNGAAPTTAKFVAVTTGTSIKTLLQVQAHKKFRVIEWGISFDGSAAATPIPCELIETDTVAATVTAHVAAGIIKLEPDQIDGTDATATLIDVGTSATGYTASGEGTITTTRLLDNQLVAPTNQYVKQFPLGREPWVAQDTNLRIRTHAAAAVNAICYVTIEI